MAAKAFREVQEKRPKFSEKQVADETLEFEKKLLDLKHSICMVCRCVSMNLQMTRYKGIDMCTHCKTRKSHMYNQKTMLPVWYNDDGITQYHQPKELAILREAEKLLIAQLAAYVPLHHIQRGQTGCKGHVCCFPQVRSDSIRVTQIMSPSLTSVI